MPVADGGPRRFHLHLVSDSTGETVLNATRACIAQFEGVQPIEHFWNMVRTERQLALALEEVEGNPGPVIFTLLDKRLRMTLEESCRRLKVPCIPVLDTVFSSLAAYLGIEGKLQPGRQHALDDVYFNRMEALDFAIAHDDGQNHWDLHEADVVLVGVSRTSKTPTCLYLANRGVKAANIPIVLEVPLPADLEKLRKPLIVGLTNDPERLVQIRRHRLKHLNQSETDYVDMDKVRAEVIFARRLFARNRWPVIDVTRRSIEETAAEVLNMLAHREVVMLPPLSASPAKGGG